MDKLLIRVDYDSWNPAILSGNPFAASIQNDNFSDRGFWMELEKDLSQKRQYLDYDRYKIPVTSVAVLADNSPLWNPPPFQYGMWGSTMGLDYLKTKLLDYKDKWLYLENHDNRLPSW